MLFMVLHKTIFVEEALYFGLDAGPEFAASQIFTSRIQLAMHLIALQFLNVLFSLRPSAVRRFHGHARSQWTATVNSILVCHDRSTTTNSRENQAVDDTTDGFCPADTARRRLYRGYG